MKARRLMARLLLPFAIWYAVILPRQAFAGLPVALYFAAEMAAPILVRSLVVRAAANAPVIAANSPHFVALSAAANDAVFASQLATWQASGLSFGAITFAILGGRTIWVQAHKDEPVVKNPETETGFYARVADYSYNAVTVPLDAVVMTRDDALEVFSQRIVQLGHFSDCRRAQTTGSSGSVNWPWVEKQELSYDYGFVQCKTAQDVWADARNYQVNVERLSKEVEKRDSTLRVLRVDGGFKPDQTDPDWNNGWIDTGIMNATGNYPNFNKVGAIDLIMPASNEDTSDEALLQFAPYGDGVQVRTADPVENPDTGIVETTVKTVRTDPQGRPQTVEQYSHPGVPGTLPNLTDPYPSNNTTPGSSNFPSDYARQGEVGSGVDRLLNKGTTPPDPEIDTTKFDDLFFKDTFKNLLEWRLPSHSADCPKPEFVFKDTTYKFEVQCTLFDQYKGDINTAMTAVWTVLALFIVMRA